MRLLELFKGTGSIGNAFEAKGWEVVSVDNEPKFNATHTVDIMHFDYQQYDKDYFNAVWASPPCQMYSIARTRAKIPRDMDASDKLVMRTREIIAYFNPEYWFIENPFLVI